MLVPDGTLPVESRIEAGGTKFGRGVGPLDLCIGSGSGWTLFACSGTPDTATSLGWGSFDSGTITGESLGFTCLSWGSAPSGVAIPVPGALIGNSSSRGIGEEMWAFFTETFEFCRLSLPSDRHFPLFIFAILLPVLRGL